jgi:hypothetical protein
VVFHLSEETVGECPECLKEGCLTKVLTAFTTNHNSVSTKQKVGQATEEFIQDAKQDLHQQRDTLEKKR